MIDEGSSHCRAPRRPRIGDHEECAQARARRETFAAPLRDAGADHDSDLLALLELLDPENYRADQLESFKERTAKRVELGRAFLALRSATVPALVKLHAGKLAALLPNDARVKELVGELSKAGTDAKAIQHELHLHISETYRIHRRMLRTRRRWLAGAQNGSRATCRRALKLSSTKNRTRNSGTALEDWRAEASERIEAGSKLREVAAAEYVRLAESIAANPEKLSTIVAEVIKSTKATPDGEKLLKKLIDDKLAWQIAEARLDLIAESLRRRAAKRRAKQQVCRLLPDRAPLRGPRQTSAHALLEHGRKSCQHIKRAGAGRRFVLRLRWRSARSGARYRATGEEGFNLQFAKAVFFHDLPWSPMRLEQRLGRLDRIDRIGAIPCVVFTSGEATRRAR